VQLENSFTVLAPPERAWDLLNDVPRVVPCMPGAELTQVVDENTWKATMHVKLGPVALEFDTDVQREHVDEDRRSVVLLMNARDRRGRGRMSANLESKLDAAPDGTIVTLVTNLELHGSLKQFGSGLIPGVAAQMTERFAECIAAQLRDSEAEGPTSTEGQASAPLGGMRLALVALWRSLLGIVRR
jgi:carbon monoxide dehydrogenase subunit G